MSELPPLNHRHHDAVRVRTLLRDPAARRDANAFVLEGPRIVADALVRGVDLEGVYLGPGARAAFAPLVERVQARSIPVRDLKEGVLEKIGSTRTPQPVLAVAPLPPPRSVAALRPGLVLVGTGISDPGNLGTMVRTAEAAGASGVVLAGGVDPWNPKVVRGSAGAVLGVPIVQAEDLAVALAALAARGWRTVGADAAASVTYTDADLAGSCALVVGSEAHGIDATVAAGLDVLVRIPMAGEIESLNVAVAASILMFEAARQGRGG